MGRMDKVDSALGWMLERGYGSLVLCLFIVAMAFLFQRQVDNEQSRILADSVSKLDNVAESVKQVSQTVVQVTSRQDRAEDRANRMDEFGTKAELRRKGLGQDSQPTPPVR